MSRMLQVKWSDEDFWHDVRPLTSDEDHIKVLREARANWEESKKRYPHHTFIPKLRVMNK